MNEYTFKSYFLGDSILNYLYSYIQVEPLGYQGQLLFLLLLCT